ncbi:hypothetical protein QCA50_003343 [Cerrena zonata]|uniref:F-box domain-containing protein n=1 Tax=Cerrena zonata TaxID=2478898 RepID=A0AAW0GK14_9APHY
MAAAVQQHLSLDSLLDIPSWQLPGWDDSLAVHGHSAQKPDADTVDKLDVSLAILSRYRNSLRPFNRLTSDILVLIFSQLLSEHADPHNDRFGSYPWMGVAQVCHFWRHVALTTPLLWTHISTRYCTAALACIERSSEAGLSLFIYEDSNEATMSKVLTAIIPHIHRLRHLYVPSNMMKDDNGNIRQVLQPLINSKAPALETFETQFIRFNAAWIPMHTLFTGHTPSLTRLKLHFMLPRLSAASFGKLRVLSFTGRKSTPTTLPMSDFLDILEACPLLEQLRAEKFTLEAARNDDTRKVTLENLQLLQLGRSKGSLVADFLNRLHIPECAIKLKVHFDRYDENKFFMGIPLPHELDSDHPLNDIRKMHISWMNGRDGVEIFGATLNQPFHIHGFIEGDTVSNLGDMDVISGTFFQSIIRAFNFDSLEEFGMTEYRNSYRWQGISKKGWEDTFRRMPKLKAFHLTSDGGYDEGFSRSILAALEGPDRSGNLFCPQLESLDVHGDKTWSSLQCYEIALARKEKGHPLKRVSMKLSHYATFSDSSETDLPLLRKHVETVNLEPQDISFPEFPEAP